MTTTTSYPNPFILERADPYIIKGPDGYYYFTASYPMKSESDPEGYDRLILRRSRSLIGLANAEEITVWRTGNDTFSHRFIWAPELHFIAGKWYVFYAGSEETENRWAFDCHVLMCDSEDPYTGSWIEKGKFQALPEDTFSFTGFSLDMTYFEAAGRSYVIWAQHNDEKISCLYLGEVNPKEPWKLISMPMLLTKPEYDWEKVRYAVNEGPAVLQHDKKIFVCFSASGTGPGHNSFTKDENGNDVFVYHARSRECYEGTCGYAGNDPLYDPCRHARLHTVTWSEYGMPILR